MMEQPPVGARSDTHSSSAPAHVGGESRSRPGDRIERREDDGATGAGRGRVGGLWFEALRPVCEAACAQAARHPVEVVLFYAARWCQKRTRESEPNLAGLDEEAMADAAARVVRN